MRRGRLREARRQCSRGKRRSIPLSVSRIGLCRCGYIAKRRAAAQSKMPQMPCRADCAIKADATKARRAELPPNGTPRATAGNAGKQGGRRGDGAADAKNFAESTLRSKASSAHFPAFSADSQAQHTHTALYSNVRPPRSSAWFRGGVPPP